MSDPTEQKYTVTRSGRVYNMHLAPVRVACITLDGSTLVCRISELGSMFSADDDNTYTLSFKTMTAGEYAALGEFNGF